MEPYYETNELYKKIPKTLYVSSLDKLEKIRENAEKDGNRVFNVYIECNCPGHTANRAVGVTFGYSCVIEYLFVVCERCALNQPVTDKQLIETLYK